MVLDARHPEMKTFSSHICGLCVYNNRRGERKVCRLLMERRKRYDKEEEERKRECGRL